jgi:predicted metal-dependent hydrolase
MRATTGLRKRAGETGAVRVGDRVLAFTVVRSARRRKTLTISLEPSAEVRVAAPRFVPAAEIEALVLRRAGWILRHLDRVAAREAPERWLSDGASLPYLGGSLRLALRPSPARQARVERCGEELQVFIPAAFAGERQRTAIARALERWYRDRAAEQFADAVRIWSPLVGAEPCAVLVRAQRRRWGSCSTRGVLRLNWRLVLTPPELIDYVVVHELAHLRVPNHSPAFWAEVARVLPDWKRRRRRLTEIGPSLAF